MSFVDTHLQPNHRNFNGTNFPSFSKPRIVGYFSVDKDRTFKSDGSNCKFLQLPANKESLRLDLNKGYETVLHKPDVDEKINHLLTFILHNIHVLNDNKPPPEPLCTNHSKPLVICFRGLLRLLMCTPYEYQTGWIILATKFRGIIYLCAQDTSEAKHRKLTMTEQSRKYCSYGFKFEQYILSDNPNEPINSDNPVYESEEFCCMFKSKLNGQPLLYGAEMDGIDTKMHPNLSNCNIDDWNNFKFVEVKVKGKEFNERQMFNFRKFKLCNWWSQSFLVGIERIIIGERNNSGIVESIDEISVSQIPKIVDNHWSPAVCLEFCSKFIEKVQEIMNDIDCSSTVIKFEWEPKQYKSIRCTKFVNVPQYTFLPDWYINKVKSKSSI